MSVVQTLARVPSVLIIDDDMDLASNVRDILQEEGYRVEVAHNSETAIRLCRQAAFDVAICDIKLPDISGIGLTQELAKMCHQAEVVIVTDYASLDTAITAVKQRNVVGYQAKPLDMGSLLSLLRQVIERQQAERSARESDRLYRLLAENVADVI
jgi:DNA-binding NtrC family response regulator